MLADSRVYSLPRWRVTRWLAECGPDNVPEDVRVALAGSLYGTLPVFIGGLLNTLVVAAVVTVRSPKPLFVAWLALEIAICLARLTVMHVARREALARRPTPTDISLLLSLAWSASVGYGVLVSLATGDWVAATAACLSAGAMVGGICLRNFSAPRLSAAMVALSLGPTLPGALLAGEPIMFLVFLQIPAYLTAMTTASFRLNRMLIATMRAERENDHRARHDPLTGLANRAGLLPALEARLARPRGRGEVLALLYLDLDGFKEVNDTLGHAAGDRLLERVAERMRRSMRDGDLPARLGGDEFVVLAACRSAQEAEVLGRRLIDLIEFPYELQPGVSAMVRMSVGIALAPEHGNDVASLLAAADAALYEAKSAGGSCCRLASSGRPAARAGELPPERHACLSG